MLSRKPDQQPNGGVIRLLPLPAPPVEKESGDPATAGPQKFCLPRVKLDDQLFVDDRRDFLTSRDPFDFTLEIVLVEQEPVGNRRDLRRRKTARAELARDGIVAHF